MDMFCLDVEGVLLPEIWINVAEHYNVDELRVTTRDIQDYDVLMRQRLRLLDEHDIKLRDIQRVVAAMGPLDGAKEFLLWLRQRAQVVLLSDTYYEFAMPLMGELDYPTLLCHTLETDAGGRIAGWQMRQEDSKLAAVQAFKSLNFRVIAAGDSYNDTSMLAAADEGILFCPPDNVVAEFPEFPAVYTHEDFKKEILTLTATE